MNIINIIRLFTFVIFLQFLSVGQVFSASIGNLIASPLITKSHKVSNRTSHSDEATGFILDASSSINITTELNSDNTLSVKLSDPNGPIQSTNINWTIIQPNTSLRDSQGAFFNVNSDSANLEIVQATDINGISSVSLNTGEITDVFQVTATANINLPTETTISLTQTFHINTGLTASVVEDTPEQSIATTFDSLCPQLQDNSASLDELQQGLLSLCNQLESTSASGDNEKVSTILREISPEEVATQASVGAGFTNQQISNIASRISAVRKGVSSVSLGQLSFRLNGINMPGSVLNQALMSSLTKEDESSSEIPGLFSNRFGLFMNGSVSLGDRDPTSQEDGFDYNSYGLTFGSDYRINNLSFAGLALGISNSNVDLNNNGGDLSVNGLSLSAYGNHYFAEQYYIEAVLNFGYNNYDMNRRIDLQNNTPIRTAKSDTSSFQNGFSLGGGYEMYDGPLSANFYGRFNYVKTGIDSFSETGAQELNIAIKSQDVDSLVSSFGVQLNYTHSTQWGVLIPFLWASWEHEYLNKSYNINGSFVNDQFDTAFSIKTESPDRNYFTSGQGISAVFPHGLSAYFRFETVLGRENVHANNIAFGGRYELQF